MFSLFNQYENPVAVTIQLLKRLHVKVTSYAIVKAILDHPDYPSILSISDALNTWHIDNTAINIDPQKLTGLPLPFIAFTKTNGGAFVTVTNINNDSIVYSPGTGSEHSKPLASFIKDFSGIVLLAQANEASGQSGYNEAKRKETMQQIKIPLFILAGIILIVFAVSNLFAPNSFLSYGILLILKFSGLLVSCLLLWYEADKTITALQKICSGRKVNCNAVLNSKASNIFGASWSEIGLFYFAGGFLLLLLTANNYSSTAGLQLVQFINLLALPYIFFSVYYQWRIAKQWCTLCLAVQAILLLESVAGSVFNPFSFNIFKSFSLSILPTAITSFVLPVITWLIVKPLLYKQQKAKQDFRSLQRIKLNKDIFNVLLEKQKHINEPMESLGITLGNKDATNTLIKVCNPYCRPCAVAHSEIEKLLEENNDLKVHVIFTATNEEGDVRTLAVKHLLAIAEKNNETLTKMALDDWYMAEKKDYAAFANKYPINGELKMQDKKIDGMKEWCDKAEIKVTPTIFYNSYQLPDVYNIGDLKYFLVE